MTTKKASRNKNLIEIFGPNGQIFMNNKKPSTKELKKNHGLISFIKNLKGENFMFQSCCFNTKCNLLATIDQRGQVYVFNMLKNTYSLIKRTGVEGTFITFSNDDNILVIGYKDGYIRMLNIQTKDIIKTIHGHGNPITKIQFNNDYTLCLTTCKTHTILWQTGIKKQQMTDHNLNISSTDNKDLDWQRIRSLTSNINTDELHEEDENGDYTGSAIFTDLKHNNDVITCLSKSIVSWNINTFDMSNIYQVPLNLLMSSSSKSAQEQVNIPYFKLCSINHQYNELAAYDSNYNCLYIWDYNTQQCLRAIDLPSDISHVFDISYVPYKTNIIIVKTAFNIFFINTTSSIIIKNIPILYKNNNVTSCIYKLFILTSSKYAISLLSNGIICLFDMKITLLDYINQADQSSTLKQFEHSLFISDNKEQEQQVDQIINGGSKDIRKIYDENYNLLKNNPEDITQIPSLNTIHLHNHPKTSLLKRNKLQNLLQQYGNYPTKHRLLIWQILLQIPYNVNAFNILCTKGIHKSYLNLEQDFPLPNRRLMRQLQIILSCLAYHNPIFSTIDYLPAFIFPFIKLYPNQLHIAFEIILTIINNYCTNYYELYPNPPLHVLHNVVQILKQFDHKLADFLSNNFNVIEYIWPLLSTLCINILTTTQWLILMDHYLSNPKGFIQFFIVSYLISHRLSLLQLKNKADLSRFLNYTHPISIKIIIKQAYKLQLKTMTHLQPKSGKSVHDTKSKSGKSPSSSSFYVLPFNSV